MISAVFIGDESLLISCAEEWVSAGRSITAVISADSSIQS